MTDEELEQTFDLRDKISEAVTELVNRMTEGVPREIDELARMQLTETYRFWRF